MKILFVSLGCDKNLVDSEEMLGTLRDKGFSFTDDENEADAAIVNTCCFIMDAQKESIDQILALAERRTEGSLKALIVTGCMAQRYKEEILKEIPEVDAVIGTTAQRQIAGTLEEILSGNEPSGTGGKLLVEDENQRTGTDAERVVTTGGGASCDDRRLLQLSQDRGRMRQAVHLLRDPVDPGPLQKHSDGGDPCGRESAR